jgi:hypothetical protein
MESWITTIGIPAVVVILLLREILPYISHKKQESKRSTGQYPKPETTTILQLVKDIKGLVVATHEKTAKLDELHNVRDGDGVPMVYQRRSLEKAVEKQTEKLDKLTRALERLIERMAEREDG